MRKFFHVLAVTGLAVLLILLVLWVVLFYTGHTGRSYAVLRPDAQVIVGGQETRVAQVAERYQPLLFMAEDTVSPAHLYMWYEVVDSGDTLVLIYHPVWENEEHPDRVIDLLYGVFRVANYGYPLFDTEYVQIDVTMDDGLVDAVRFETGFGENYYVQVSEHLVEVVTRQGAGGYLATTRRRSGEFVGERTVLPLFQNGVRPCLGIQTWNHLLVWREEKDEVYTRPIYMHLVYLTDEDYAHYKIARRSQGDYVTREDRRGVLVVMTATLLIVSAMGGLWVTRLLRALPEDESVVGD
jgi:hypothetical protein